MLRGSNRSCLYQPVAGPHLQRTVDEAVNLGACSGFWPLSETSGTRKDMSANGHHLTDNATVTDAIGPSAALPLASQFTRANSEYLNVTDTAALSAGQSIPGATLMTWFYRDSNPAANSYMHLLGKWGAAGQREHYIGWANDATSHRYYYSISEDGTGETGIRADSHGTPALTTWTLVAAFFDSVAKLMSIQVNDGAVDGQSYTTDPGNGTEDFRFGITVDHFPDGRMAGGGLWRRRLQADERSYYYMTTSQRQLPSRRAA